MGFHRYVMVWLYLKHKERKARAEAAARRAPARHRPAADLQRDVRRRPAARLGRGARLPEGQARDPGARRLDGRNHRDREPGSRALRRAGLRHPLPAPQRPHRLQGGRPRRGARAGHGRVRAHLRRRLRGAARHAPEDAGPFRGRAGRDGAGALGPHQPGLLAAHRGPGDHARRPLHPRARRAQPLGPLLQLQRHRRHLAPERDRRRRRLAARHAHRGPRPVLPRADARLALRVPARPRGAGRAAGRDERVQDAAAALGQGLGAGLQEAACRACWPRSCRGARRSRRPST